MARGSEKVSKTRTATPQRAKRASRKNTAIKDDSAADSFNTEDHVPSVKRNRRSKLKQTVIDDNKTEEEQQINKSSNMSIIDPDNNINSHASINEEKEATVDTNMYTTNDILQNDSHQDKLLSQDNENGNTESTLEKSSHNDSMSSEFVHVKELLTAPFVLYNSQTRKVEANPEYNSTIVLELSRLQGIMNTIVRKTLQQSTEYTPKELLFACERALLYTYVNAIRLDSLLSTSLLSSECESCEGNGNVNTASGAGHASNSASQSILSALNQHNNNNNNKNARMSLSYSVVDDQAASKYTSMMETHYGQRNASPIVMISLGHVLSEGNAQRELHQLVQLLSHRMAQEREDTSNYSKKTLEERAALQATRNNVHDLQLLLQDIATAYKAVHTKWEMQLAHSFTARNATNTSSLQDMHNVNNETNSVSLMSNDKACEILQQSHYKLLHWILTVERDRQVLVQDQQIQWYGKLLPKCNTETLTNTHSFDTLTTSSWIPEQLQNATEFTTPLPLAKIDTIVKEFDLSTGKLILERHSRHSPWGLLINSEACVIGVENALRNSSADGEKLFMAIQQQQQQHMRIMNNKKNKDYLSVLDRENEYINTNSSSHNRNAITGLPILEANRKRIRMTGMTPNEVQEHQMEMMTKLQQSMQTQELSLIMKLDESVIPHLHVPHEVGFYTLPQGNEGGSVGQKVVLILQRASLTVPWGITLRLPSSTQLNKNSNPSTSIEKGTNNQNTNNTNETEASEDNLVFPILSSIAPTLMLSDKAKNFLFDYRDKLQIVQVNHHLMRTPHDVRQLPELMKSATLLDLELRVVTTAAQPSYSSSSSPSSSSQRIATYRQNSKARHVEATATSITSPASSKTLSSQQEQLNENHTESANMNADLNDVDGKQRNVKHKSNDTYVGGEGEEDENDHDEVKERKARTKAQMISDEHEDVLDLEGNVWSNKTSKQRNNSNYTNTRNSVDSDLKEEHKWWLEKGQQQATNVDDEEQEKVNEHEALLREHQIDIDDTDHNHNKEVSYNNDHEAHEAMLDYEKNITKINNKNDILINEEADNDEINTRDFDDKEMDEDTTEAATHQDNTESNNKALEQETMYIEQNERNMEDQEPIVTEKKKRSGKKKSDKSNTKQSKRATEKLSANATNASTQKRKRRTMKEIAEDNERIRREQELEKQQQTEIEQQQENEIMKENDAKVLHEKEEELQEEEHDHIEDNKDANNEHTNTDNTETNVSIANESNTKATQSEPLIATKTSDQIVQEIIASMRKKRTQADSTAATVIDKSDVKKVDDSNKAESNATSKQEVNPTTRDEVNDSNNNTHQKDNTKTPINNEDSNSIDNNNKSTMKTNKISETQQQQELLENETNKEEHEKNIVNEHNKLEKSEDASSKTVNVNESTSMINNTTNVPMQPTGRVSLSELLDAPPLTFSNNVTLRKFDGSTMELTRPSTDVQWLVKVALLNDAMVMTELPPLPPQAATHPFIRALYNSSSNNNNTTKAANRMQRVIDKIDGTDITNMSRSAQAKLLQGLKKLTRVSFVLRSAFPIK